MYIMLHEESACTLFKDSTRCIVQICFVPISSCDTKKREKA
jgi:hypothetical protein